MQAAKKVIIVYEQYAAKADAYSTVCKQKCKKHTADKPKALGVEMHLYNVTN